MFFKFASFTFDPSKREADFAKLWASGLGGGMGVAFGVIGTFLGQSSGRKVTASLPPLY